MEKAAISDAEFKICKALGRKVSFDALPQGQDSLEIRTIRAQMREMYLSEYLHADCQPETGEERREVGETHKDLCTNDHFNAQWDTELASKGYSDTALNGTKQQLREALRACCLAVNAATNGAAAEAHAALRAVLKTCDIRSSFPAIDRLNPYLLQVYQEWSQRGFTARDLDLL